MPKELGKGRHLPWVSMAYVCVSALGWLSADRLFDAAPLAYILAQWLLGPLAFAFNSGSESLGESLLPVWILCYLAATAMLVFCMFLFRRRAQWTKITAILIGALVWLASGFINFTAMFRGI